jgi:hypothetical protein
MLQGCGVRENLDFQPGYAIYENLRNRVFVGLIDVTEGEGEAKSGKCRR